jgi:putative photosynthetic complex assembly protein 2
VAEFAVPAAFAALVWWFATGAILYLDGLPRRTFARSMAAATAVMLASACVAFATRNDRSVSGAYAAFTSAILIWGWLEMSFLMGFVTGPRKESCHDRCAGWSHFLHATEAIIYNELAIAAGAAGIVAVTWQCSNRVCLWTFLILWAMRLSAKLNLFFGVPNVGEQFLPDHLQYLKSFFRRRRMNFLFPVSIIASTLTVLVLAQKFWAAADAFRSTAYALTTSLLALAVLEHWFMVLPLPSERLWRWALRQRPPRPQLP